MSGMSATVFALDVVLLLIYATPGCFSSSVPKTPLDIFFLSYANVSATSSTAAISGPRNSTEPAFFAFAASAELKSSTIGMVHVVPLTSLPEDMTDSKSACPKNPSSGLNIPSAIFSISLWIDAETCESPPCPARRPLELNVRLQAHHRAAVEYRSLVILLFFGIIHVQATLAVSLTFPPPSASP